MIRLTLPITLALFLTGCSHTQNEESEKETTSLHKIADKMRAQGNQKTASGFYEQILEKDPENLEAHLKLAEMLRHSHQNDIAFKQLQKASVFHPNDERLSQEFVKTYIALNQGSNAEVEAQKLVTKDSSNPSYHNLLGVALDSQGKHHKAQESYKKSLDLKPNQIMVESNLGLSEALSGNTTSAIDRLKALNQTPEATVQDRQNLAVAYALAGDLDQADTLFRVDMDDVQTNENRSYFTEMTQTAPAITDPLKPELESHSSEPLTAPKITDEAKND